jgi:hypothetical protein
MESFDLPCDCRAIAIRGGLCGSGSGSGSGGSGDADIFFDHDLICTPAKEVE